MFTGPPYSLSFAILPVPPVLRFASSATGGAQLRTSTVRLNVGVCTVPKCSPAGEPLGYATLCANSPLAASRAAGAQLRNVAGQLGGARQAREDREQQNGKEKEQSVWTVLFFGIRQLPIFPGRRQPSIVGVQGLNFCVRDGNRWNPLA